MYFMRALPHLRTSAIAIVTILAMLIVPACGSLCASMSNCSSSAASADSDACHHENVAAYPDSETLSSSASCNQQSPLVAILAASDSSFQLESVLAANASLLLGGTNHVSGPDSQVDEFSSLEKLHQQSIPLENLSVLRI
jgi:hypothetical protein